MSAGEGGKQKLGSQWSTVRNHQYFLTFQDLEQLRVPSKKIQENHVDHVESFVTPSKYLFL